MTMCFLLAAVFIWHQLKIGHSPRTLVFFLWPFSSLRDFHALFRCCLFIPSYRFGTRRARAVSCTQKNYRDKFIRWRVVVGTITAKSLLGHLATANWFLRPFTLYEWWLLFFNWFLNGNSIWNLSPYRTTLQDLINSPLLIICQIFFLHPCPRTCAPTRSGLAQAIARVVALSDHAPRNHAPTDESWLPKDIYRTVSSSDCLSLRSCWRVGTTEFSNRYMTGIFFAAVVTLGIISYAMFLPRATNRTVSSRSPICAALPSTSQSKIYLPMTP